MVAINGSAFIFVEEPLQLKLHVFGAVWVRGDILLTFESLSLLVLQCPALRWWMWLLRRCGSSLSRESNSGPDAPSKTASSPPDRPRPHPSGTLVQNVVALGLTLCRVSHPAGTQGNDLTSKKWARPPLAAKNCHMMNVVILVSLITSTAKCVRSTWSKLAVTATFIFSTWVRRNHLHVCGKKGTRPGWQHVSWKTVDKRLVGKMLISPAVLPPVGSLLSLWLFNAGPSQAQTSWRREAFPLSVRKHRFSATSSLQARLNHSPKKCRKASQTPGFVKSPLNSFYRKKKNSREQERVRKGGAQRKEREEK